MQEDGVDGESRDQGEAGEYPVPNPPPGGGGGVNFKFLWLLGMKSSEIQQGETNGGKFQ